MKRFTKHFSALLLMIILCGLTACKENREPFSDSSDASQSSTESSVSTQSSTGSSQSSTDSKQSSTNSAQSSSGGSGAAHGVSESELFTSSLPPDEPPISSQQNEVTRTEPIDVKLNDQLVTLPCKVKDIKNVTIEVGRNFSVKQRDNGSYMSSSLFDYDGTNAGTIYLDGDCSNISDLGEVTVIGIAAGDSRVPVSYMGLTFGASKDDIIRTLGAPADENDDYIYYYIEPEGSVTFSLNSENKVEDIAIFLNIR